MTTLHRHTRLGASARKSAVAPGGLEALENRSLLAADLFGASVVFISDNVSDADALARTTRGAEVVRLDSHRDIFGQIDSALAGRRNLASIQFITHGSSGRVDLGGGQGLDAASLARNAGSVQAWGKALAEDGDLLLWGCDVGQGARGRAFVSEMSRLTGADVGASTNRTGAWRGGGDWMLEVKTGAIESIRSFTVPINYAYTLASPVISGASAGQTVNDTDTVRPFDGVVVGADAPAASLSISVTLDSAAKGAFTAASLAASGFTSAGGGVYTFTGTAAQATAALSRLAFDPSDNRVNLGATETTTFTISASNGVDPATTDSTTTVDSTNVNDAPTISGVSTGQAVADNATVSPFSGVTIGDADAPAQTIDVQVALDIAGKGAFTGASLTASGFTSSGNGVYAFSGTAAAATTAIRQLVFQPTANRVAVGSTETTTFSITVSDATAPGVSNTGTTVVSTSQNNAPTLGGASAGQAVNDNATLQPFSAFTFTDPDPTQQLAVSVTLDTAAKGVFTSGSLASSGFILAGGGQYTFTGTAAQATIAIRQLVFQPAANRVNPTLTETTTFTVSANDGVAAAATSNTTTVVSTSVNDAPTITGASAGQAVNDTATILPFSGLTIGDADSAQSLTVTVTLDTAAKGVFTAGSLSTSGFTDMTGGVYSFTGTAAQATTAIRALVFDPTNNRVAVASTETTTFTVSVDDSIAAAATNSTTTAVSTSVNDAPTISGAVAGQTLADTGTITPFAGVTIADVDPGQGQTVTVTLDTAAKGSFTGASLTASGFVSSGGGVYTFTGTAAQATTAIQQLVFQPTADRVAQGSTETTTFTIAANDGVAAAVTNNATTAVTSGVNDAPTISGASTGQAVNDNATLNPFSGLTIADVDPGQSQSITVSLDAAAKGSFTSASLTASGFSNAGGGTYTFTGTAAQATTAIRALVFQPTANRVNPALTETTTFTVSVNDGIAAAATDNATTVVSTSVNDAPTITGAVAGQSANDNATIPPFSGVTIGDADSAQSLTVTVTLDTAAKGVFTPSSLTSSGFTDMTGGVYSFTGTAAQATTAIRALVFDPANDRVAVGSTETSTFTISVDDAVAAPTTSSATTVISTSVNDAPTISGASAGQPVDDTATLSPFAGVTIADVDPGQNQTVTVTLDNASKGVFTSASLTTSGFVSSGGGVYTFTGTAAAATTAIRALVFDPTNDRIAVGSTETTTFTIAVNDGVASAVTNNSTTVVSTSVNDAPTITGAVAGQAVNDTATISPFAALTIADTDPGQSLSITVTLDAAAKGVFTPSSLTTSGFVSGGGGVYTFTGTAAAATTAIRALSFDPTNDRVAVGGTETTTFTVSVNDGVASAVTNNTTTAVSTSVNDAPTITGAVAAQTLNDTATITPFSGLTIADVDPGQSQTVTVTLDAAAKGSFTSASLTASGFASAGGGAYTFTGTAAAATTAIRQLVFQPTANRVAQGFTETTTLTVAVNDGVAAAVTDNTTTAVTSGVNDAPTISGASSGQPVNDNATIAPFSGLTIADVDPGQSQTVTVTLDAAAKGAFSSASLTASGFTNPSSGVYSFTGSAAAATIAIRQLIFQPTANRVNPTLTETTTFTVSVNDAIAAAATNNTTTVVSTSVNDAPTITGAVAGQAVNDTANLSPFSAVTIGDADSAQSLTVTVTLDTAAKGVFTSASLTASGFTDLTGGVYSFTGTAAQATTAIRALVFDATNNRTAVGATETTTFALSVDDSIAAPATSSTTTVVSTSVNDAPTIAGASAGQPVSDNATLSPFSGLTIADVDPGQNQTVTITLDTAAKGVFTSASLTASGFTNSGGGEYSFTGTAAAATTAIQQLVFDPTNDRVSVGSTETTTFTVSVNDGVASAVTNNSTTVVSTSINDAPTVSGAAASQAVNDTGFVSPFAALTIADTDPGQGLTITVTLDTAAKGVFTPESLTASGFSSAGGGVYTFSGSASAATAAIRQLSYNPSDNRVAVASTETTTFTVSVNDGVASAVTNNTTTVVSTSVNDAPTITGAVGAQAVNDNATLLPFSGLTIADVDPGQNQTVTVTLDAAAKGVFTGASLAASGFTSAGGGVYTFTGTAAATTTAIQQLVYDPTNDRVAQGATETTTFTVSVNDGVASAVSNNTTTVVSSGVNDAPTITGVSGGQAVTDNAVVSPFSGVTIADLDPGQTQTVSVTLDAAAKGVFTAASLTSSGFANAGGGVYTFSGSAAAATTAIRALVFDPSNDRVAVGSTETTTFTVSVNDGVAAATTNNTTTVVSTSINDASTITGAVSAQALSDTSTIIPFSALTIADVDPGQSQTVTVTLDNAAKGTFTAGSLTASGFSNSGGGVYTFNGTAALATTAIRQLVFQPTANRVAQGFTETTVFTVAVDDGATAPSSNNTTTAVTSGVNDAPTISGAVASQAVNDNSTVSPFAGVTLGDVDPGQNQTVTVTLDASAKGVFTSASLTASGFSNPSAGVYSFTGNAAAATTAIRQLVFQPTANRVNPTLTETTTFTVSVNDGIAAAVTSNATTVVSTSINDAPTISGAVAGQAVNDTGFVSPFSGVSIADADAAQTLSVTVTLDTAAKGVFTPASLTASGFTNQGAGVYLFSGTAAQATAAIRALSFDPANDRVTVAATETSTFTISVDDAIAAPATNGATTVVSTSVNDAPTITGAVAAQSVTDASVVSPFTGVTIDDVDSPAQALTVTVTLDTAAKGVFTSASLTASGFGTGGGGVYTFNGTAAAATTAIRQLVFQPSNNRVNPGQTETTTFTVQANDTFTTASSNTTTVVSTPVNDAPTITGTAAGQAVNDNATISPFSGVTIADADTNQPLTVTVTLDAAAKGVFTTASLTASGFTSSGGGVYAFSGTGSAATTAIRQLVFQPTANRVNPTLTETTTLDVSVNDGFASAVTSNATTVVSTSVNDAPTIAGAVAGQTVNDNATRTAFSGVTIADADASQSLIVTVTIDAAAKGAFTTASLNASGFASAGGGAYTFTGTAAAATTAIRALVFDPANDRVAVGSTETSTFTISVDDAIAAAATNSTTTIISTSVNDLPSFSGAAAGQAVNDNATLSPFSAFTIADPDAPAQTLTTQVILDTAAKGSFTSASLTASGFTSQGSGVYAFSGTASAATTAIRQLVFQPTANRVNPGQTETTTFVVLVNDGVASSTTNTNTVVSTSVNDAPTIAGAVAAQAVNDNSTRQLFTGVTIADADAAQSLTVTVTVDDSAKGVFTGASLTTSGFVSAGAGAYTFTGTAAAATTAIRALNFDPANNRTPVGQTETSTFTISVNDAFAAAVTNNTTTAVSTSINDATLIAGGVSGQTINENQTVSPFSGLTIFDADMDQTLTITVAIDLAAKGVFTAESLTTSGFDGSGGVYTFTGSAEAATEAIRALVYDPTDNRVAIGLTETTTFTITAEDGVGTPQLNSVTTVISTSVNNAPTVTALSGPSTANRLTSFTLTATGVADADNTARSVDFYRDANGNGSLDIGVDTLLGNVLVTAGSASRVVSTVGFATGTNTFFAKANDSLGLAGAAVSTTVTITNAAPTITSLARSIDPVVNLGDSITFTAAGAADSDGTVARVEFYRDADGDNAFDAGVDELLGQDTSAAGGYTLTTSTSGFDVGTNRYFARTIDNDGAASAAVTITGRVNAAPTIATLAPSSGSVARRSTVTLSATGVADSDGTIASVSFYRDANGNGTFDVSDTLLGSAVTASGGAFSLAVNTASFSLGNNTFFARVRDNNGAMSAAGTTQVAITNLAPVVATVTATPARVANLGDSVTLTATSVTDLDSTISTVQFYRDADGDNAFDATLDTLLGSDSSVTGGFLLVTSTSGFTVGTNRVFARAIDSDGGVSSVATTTFVINAAPTVASVTSSAGSVARRSTFTLTANTPADSDGTIASVSFFRDANGNGTYETSDTLLGSDTLAAGGYTFLVNTTGFAAGANTFFARTTDNNGAVSAAVSVQVTVTNLAPTVGSVTVAPTRIASLGASLTITAVTVADLDSTISTVQFYRDADGDNAFDAALDTLLGSDASATGGYLLTTSTSGFTVGTNRIFVRAIDSDGGVGATATTTVVVNAAPTIASVTASAGSVARRSTFTLTANTPADSDGTIASVSFFRDANGNGTYETSDTLLGSDTLATGGYTFLVNTTGFAAGTNTFFARTTDNNGALSAAVSVQVNVSNLAPTVASVTAAPTRVTNLGDNLTITAVTVADLDSAISTVQFYRDDGDNTFNASTDTLLGSDASATGGYLLVTSTSGFTVGTNRLFVRAIDSDGGVGATATTTVVVNAAPTIASVTASAGSVARRSTFTLTANTPADSDGTIASVSFFRDANGNGTYETSDTLLGSDTLATGGYTFLVNTTGFAAGTNTFFARTTDNNGAVSATVSVQATITNLAPTIGSVVSSVTTVAIPGSNINLQALGFADLDGTIASAQFYLDNGDNTFDAATDTLLGSDASATGGYLITTATTAFSAGVNRVYARVIDNDSGASSVVSTTVTVNAAPTIAGVTANPDPISRAANYTLTAVNPADSNGTITRVEFYLDRSVLGTFESGADLLLGIGAFTGGVWRLTLAGSALSAGSHTFFARAMDNSGAFSSAVSVTVVAA